MEVFGLVILYLAFFFLGYFFGKSSERLTQREKRLLKQMDEIISLLENKED